MKFKISYYKSKKKVGAAAWCVSLTDSEGVNRGRHFYETESEAIREEQKLRDALGDIQVPGDEWDWNFEHLFSEFKKSYRFGSDRQNKERQIGIMLKFKINGVPLSKVLVRQLSAKDINFKLIPQIQEGRTYETARNYWSNFAALVRHGIARECRSNDPLTGITMPPQGCKPSTYNKSATKLDRDIVKAITDELPTGPVNWNLIAKFAAQTGLRQGEQRVLTWGDIDFDKTVVSVNKVYRKCSETGAWKTFHDTTKTGSSGIRKVEIPKDIVDELKEFYLKQGRPENGTLIWTSRTGRIISDSRFGEALRPACDRAGQNRIRWHDLRHYFGTQLCVRYGSNYKKIMEKMGHTKISTTIDIYSRIVEDLQEITQDTELMVANYDRFRL